MTDEPHTPSGSRWEPEPDATPAAPLDDPAAEERRAQLRGRAVLAGAATALTLGGGLTGFVIGHATAGDDTNGFRPANFSNQGPGGQQGPPAFRDHNGDGSGSGATGT
jgi:hypothetical protein